MEARVLYTCALSSISIVLDTIDTDSQTTLYHIEMKITGIAYRFLPGHSPGVPCLYIRL